MPEVKNTTAINSPFRYAGGKFYARKLILEHVIPHDTYIEPFCGGASIFFVKEKVRNNWLNDIDDDLINTLRIIKESPEELIRLLTRRNVNESRIPANLVRSVNIGEPMPASKELHHFFKYNFEPQNDLERAERWFYLNRTSYSGIMNFQNMYWGYGDKYSMTPKNWPRNIRRTSVKLQGVRLTASDFEQVIDNSPNNAFLFIDPPYFNAEQDKFYQHHFTPDDHQRLLRCLLRNRNRLNYFITYDNVPEIRRMYNWANEMYDKEWNYCLQRTDDQKNGTDTKGKRYKGQELFILDYR